MLGVQQQVQVEDFSSTCTFLCHYRAAYDALFFSSPLTSKKYDR